MGSVATASPAHSERIGSESSEIQSPAQGRSCASPVHARCRPPRPAWRGTGVAFGVVRFEPDGAARAGPLDSLSLWSERSGRRLSRSGRITFQQVRRALASGATRPGRDGGSPAGVIAAAVFSVPAASVDFATTRLTGTARALSVRDVDHTSVTGPCGFTSTDALTSAPANCRSCISPPSSAYDSAFRSCRSAIT
jgi:hypothetical protein